MTEQEKKEALKRWQEHCKRVERMTSQERVETEAERKRNMARALKDYDCFCQRYLSHYCQCPNAKFHNEAARYIASHPELRLVCKWPRGHAKSVHLDIGIPLWLKFRDELHVMVLVGKSEDSADGLLGDLQAELQYNQYIIRDFGEQYNSGMWQEGEFVTRDQCAFFSRGRGQSPRGLRFREMRPDYIVVDDLDDDEMCRSEARVREMTNWIKEALFGCFGGKDGRFIMVGNLISKNSVLQKIIDTPTVKTIEVNAIDRNGNPAWPECYTIEKLRSKEEFMGYRSFQKIYEQPHHRGSRVPGTVDTLEADAEAEILRADCALHRPFVEILRKERLQGCRHDRPSQTWIENRLTPGTASAACLLPPVQRGRNGALALRCLRVTAGRCGSQHLHGSQLHAGYHPR